MLKRKKRPALLLEVLIALGLVMIILTTLSFFLSHVDAISTKTKKQDVENFKLRLLSLRLSDVLPKALCETEKDFFFFTTGDDGLFLSGSMSLVFSYYNHVSLEKGFSGHVLGRLFVDKEGKFCLATWPSPLLWSQDPKLFMEKQVLLDDVEELSFFFYTPAIKNMIANPPQKKSGSSEPEVRGDWTSSWRNDHQELPAMVKVILKRKQHAERDVFVFPLPFCRQTIVYTL